MAGFLQSLVTADDSCGPVNPLQALVKGVQGEGSQLGRDSINAVPSSSPWTSFRSRLLLNPSEIDANAQAKAFFQQSHNRNAEPYDFQAMGHALPSQQRPLPPAWASDFMAEVQIDGNPATLLSERAWGKSRASDHASNATWASDFTRPTQLPTSPSYVNQAPVLQLRPFSPPMNADMHPVGYGPQSLYSQAPGFAPYESFPQPREVSGVETSQQPRYQELSSTDDPQTASDWESAFLQHLQHTDLINSTTSDIFSTSTGAAHESLTARPHSPTQLSQNDSQDLLSRTAGDLLNNISQDLEGNTKMRESNFMELMRKLRDKAVTVEGNEIVETAEHVSPAARQVHDNSRTSAESPSTGTMAPICVWPPSMREGMDPRSVPVIPAASQGQAQTVDELQASYADMTAMLEEDRAQRAQRAFQGDGGLEWDFETEQREFEQLKQRYENTAVAGAGASWEEDFDFDNSLLQSGPQPPTMEQMTHQNPQQQEWANLQDQWESAEATVSGFQLQNPSDLTNYPFHARNPYLLSQHHRTHLPANTLLEKEAEVQTRPDSSQAWLNLGLKQQENEREALAIQALLRALELDSNLKEAWLALAVSYTNDNIRGKAYDAVERWVDCKNEYVDLVRQHRAIRSNLKSASTNIERHQSLTDLLVAMAREGARQEHRVDADVQIALGVMFNASEEYEKATDCFMAALSVRPDDPHLFNRLGATLANSGKSESAIEYYYRALELQPDFARATFNLSIACINLSAFSEAAEHLLRALRMQQTSDADVGAPSLQHMTETEHVESSTLLWDTLATCCNSLGRADLAAACSKRNLNLFKEERFGSQQADL